MCPEQDSNLHGSHHSHLKRARLPFRHLGFLTALPPRGLRLQSYEIFRNYANWFIEYALNLQSAVPFQAALRFESTVFRIGRILLAFFTYVFIYFSEPGINWFFQLYGQVMKSTPILFSNSDASRYLASVRALDNDWPSAKSIHIYFYEWKYQFIVCLFQKNH